MTYKQTEFKKEYIDDAVELFLESYKTEQQISRLLPINLINNKEVIKNYLKENVNEQSIAITKDNKLISYMITCYKFMFKGHRSILVQEFGHSSIEKDKSYLYRLMYMNLAQKWSDEGFLLHNICHFSNDKVLNETLYQIGFGLTINERLRDLSNIDNCKQFKISEERDINKLINIQIEHMKYYKRSPIFFNKKSDYKTVKADIEKSQKAGDLFLVYKDEKDKIQGLFILGKSCDEGEGLLLKNTNTAQIKNAYISPNNRGRGIGKALLQHSISKMKEAGYDRIFVEHETSNFQGTIFWRKYFDSFLNVSMRYIEKVF